MGGRPVTGVAPVAGIGHGVKRSLIGFENKWLENSVGSAQARQHWMCSAVRCKCGAELNETAQMTDYAILSGLRMWRNELIWKFGFDFDVRFPGPEVFK